MADGQPVAASGGRRRVAAGLLGLGAVAAVTGAVLLAPTGQRTADRPTGPAPSFAAPGTTTDARPTAITGPALPTTGPAPSTTSTTQDSGIGTTPGTDDGATDFVTLDDDDADQVLFDVPDLLPGSTGSRCLRVAYSGTVAATVRLYVTDTRGDLADWVDLAVDEGDGAGSFASCDGFAGMPLFTGTLADLAATSTSFSNGIGTWSPAAAGRHRAYRFTYTLSPDTPGTMQGQHATTTFRFEARPAR